MQNHWSLRSAGMRSASQSEQSDDDEYYIDTGMVSFRQDPDSSGPEIDSDEDTPARETLTASAYGRRPPGQPSKVPRLPKKFVESPAAKDLDSLQDIRMSGRRGRGRGKPLSAPNQQTNAVDVNASAEASVGQRGTSDAASQREMELKEPGYAEWWFSGCSKPKDPRDDLNIQSQESFPSLSSSRSNRTAKYVSNRNTEPAIEPRPLKSPPDVSGFSGSLEKLSIGDQTATKDDSKTPGLASSALAEDDGRAWCVTEQYCIQIDGLPEDIDCSEIEAVCKAYGKVLAAEKRVQSKAKVASIRIRFEDEGVRNWAVDVMNDSQEVTGLLPAEVLKGHTITVKPVDAGDD